MEQVISVQRLLAHRGVKFRHMVRPPCSSRAMVSHIIRAIVLASAGIVDVALMCAAALTKTTSGTARSRPCKGVGADSHEHSRVRIEHASRSSLRRDLPFLGRRLSEPQHTSPLLITPSEFHISLDLSLRSMRKQQLNQHTPLFPFQPWRLQSCLQRCTPVL
jgi:hypothetical protein